MNEWIQEHTALWYLKDKVHLVFPTYTKFSFDGSERRRRHVEKLALVLFGLKHKTFCTESYYIIHRPPSSLKVLSTDHSIVVPIFISWLFILELQEFNKQNWVIFQASGLIFNKAQHARWVPTDNFWKNYFDADQSYLQSTLTSLYFLLSLHKPLMQALIRTISVATAVLQMFRERQHRHFK